MVIKFKKFVTGLLAAALCMSFLSACGGGPVQESPDPVTPPVSETPVVSETPTPEPSEDVSGLLDINDHLWEIPDDATLDEKLTLEFRNFTIIRSLEKLFTAESYKAYNKAYLDMKKKGTEESFEEAVTLRNSLVQTDAIADRVWYIWGEDTPGPTVDGEEFTEAELDASLVDAYGFSPFLIKYLLDDPSSAKGNVIVIAGGGYSRRSNLYEGWPVCEKFNELGYNAFLLQRRVEPYSSTDIHMDLQRAIRVVRYYGELEGYGGMDMIAAAGFSGGGSTIIGQINECYGRMTPQVYDSDYQPDEIDAINSDLDVAMIVYGASGRPLNEENEHWPAFFLSCGTDDEGPYANTQTMYGVVKDKVPTTLNLIEGGKHGYGYGGSETPAYAPGAEKWMELADAFMQENVGHVRNALRDIDSHLWEIPDDATLDEKLTLEFRNFTIIRSLEKLFTAESYKAYNKAYLDMQKKGTEASFEEAVTLRNSLVQTDAIADRVWYIWGEDTPGPTVDGEEFTEAELDASLVDAYGFSPFLIKYLLDDPSSAKGNVIVIAGGGYSRRSNLYEGWPVCEKFNELGYNAFLLQRRVEPYSSTDIHMDMQRAIRVVRYYGEQEGYGGMDMIAAAGFSGGGMTILGQINECYGQMTPQAYDSDYQPDEIDAINSDLDVAMVVYGAFGGSLNEENANWPALFLSCGTADELGACENTKQLYENVKDKVPTTLNLIEGAKHGYGYGGSETPAYAPGAETWMELADVFMQENMGHSGK